jgi:hypothetical protein
MPEKNTALIITGMNRSGTSLAASLLQSAGLNLGAKMAPTNAGNLHGYFEDTDFVDFHYQALLVRVRPMGLEAFAFQPTPEETAQARELIAKRAQQPLWGWKDPFTCMFLDFWKGLLPEARFLFIYRHPLDVLLSLLRRGADAMADLLEGLNCWRIYNQAILDFSLRHRSQCVIANIYAAVREIGRFNEILEEKFALKFELTEKLRDSMFHPHELRQLFLPEAARELFDVLAPAVNELYERLRQVADLPLAAAPVPEDEALGAFCASVSKILATDRQGCARGALHLLIARLEPGVVDAYYEKFAQHLSEREKTARRPWLLAVGKLAQYIGEQEKAAQLTEQQRLLWMKTAKERGEIIAKLKKEK